MAGDGEREALLETYSRLASRYDQRWSFYIEATTRETLSRLRLRPTDRLLDVGCGTGALLQALSRTHPPALLTGVDPCPEMLALARAKLLPEVELLPGWAEELPFPDERFDAVVSCNVFHYVRHPLAALGEMRRVLRSGGELVITDWCDDYLACRICDWYLRAFDRAHFRVYGRKECLRLLERAARDRVEVERYRISWLWGLMTAKVTKETIQVPGQLLPMTPHP